MNKSDNINELAAALCKVQAELTPAKKDADNPFFKTKYADLTSVWDAARDVITKHGLSVTQINGLGLEGTVIIETVLMHESGQWISGELSLPLAKQDPQGVGSAITYGRRYGLAAILGIVTDIDDDGNAASGHNRQPLQAVAKPQPPNPHREAIQTTCKALNEAGDSIKWAKGTLNGYVTDFFGDGITYENANDAQLKSIAADLAKRLGSMQKTATAAGGK